jgi:hypothetical protein
MNANVFYLDKKGYDFLLQKKLNFITLIEYLKLTIGYTRIENVSDKNKSEESDEALLMYFS